MTFAASDFCKKRILELCIKVEEILDNNDWPTTDGERDGDTTPVENSIVDIIIRDIRKELR